MDAGEAHRGDELPGELYTRLLRELNLVQAAEQGREKLLGYAKLFVVVVTAISTLLFLHYVKFIGFLAVPLGVFAVLAVLQENLIR